MEFTNTTISNFEGALRGMRNPLNSWARSDSKFGITDEANLSEVEEEVIDAWIKKDAEKNNLSFEKYDQTYELLNLKYGTWLELEGIINTTDQTDAKGIYEYAFIGPKDLELAQTLMTGGTEHCKFLRQIQVCVDITAPLYWWKEFDTYKVGTTANSTSTMHTLCKNPIQRSSFSFDRGGNLQVTESSTYNDYINTTLNMCEELRKKYCLTKDKNYWRALVQMLPEAYLQTRTVTLSYANLRNIYNQRKDHKLTEWSNDFINWIHTLPYGKELITMEEVK